jgi:hypothetical protein
MRSGKSLRLPGETGSWAETIASALDTQEVLQQLQEHCSWAEGRYAEDAKAKLPGLTACSPAHHYGH